MDFKKVKYIFFILMAITYCSCSNYYYKISKDKVYKTKIFLRGPGTCSQLILLDKEGSGIAVKGRTRDYYQSKFNKFETIEIITLFTIARDSLNNVNDLIKKIETSDEVIGNFANDARRMEIFVNGKKKMDIYTWEENRFNDLVRKLSYHIPYEINSFCDPSTTFKK